MHLHMKVKVIVNEIIILTSMSVRNILIVDKWRKDNE
jgi:hypothetical protein